MRVCEEKNSEAGERGFGDLTLYDKIDASTNY